ncbi:MAG: hypothetical protein GJU73_12440 [Ferrovum sp.]|jgi:hypothetical protein|uniref:NF038122 family metalloprotease n=1 Tax=Ferrovum sp. TaxID=2609467 RepID=UPI001DA27968|nr:NF038122 family metalloprotease [Ferrovum sp.]MBW8028215.1 hypothetical protein [Ferrovum sp.]MBW8068232.1 hypothetical protein [Ferrovum sp.]
MQINLSWDSSTGAAPSFFKAAVQQAANLLGAELLNPVSVTIQVGWNEIGGTAMAPNSGGLGGPSSSALASPYGTVSVNNQQITNLLVNQASLDGLSTLATTLSSTPLITSGYMILSSAQAKVMGVANPSATSFDGEVGFSLPSYATYNETVSVALHELAHALGRINGWVDTAGNVWNTSLDLYTYSAPGQLWNPASPTPGYFSLNGGVTSLGTFSTSDTADFANISDPFAAIASNSPALTPLDLQVLQTLGFDVAHPITLASNSVAHVTPNSFITGSGGDTVIFSSALSNYHINALSTSGMVTVQDTVPNQDAISTLLDVARLQFTDTSLAFDTGTTQSTGEAALLLGAAFGTQTVSDKVLLGDWIKFFDNGGTLQQAAQALVSSGNISAAGNTSFVTTLWQHVIGTPIDATDLSLYTNALANGTFTQASLLIAAANTIPNQAHLNLTGLGQTGLGFTPVSTNAQGIDSVSYASASTNYTLTGNPGAGTITVTGAGTTDTLIGVQHVKFTDVKLAFDMGSNQAGGQAAELIGAAYGDGALSNPTLVTSSLTAFEGGTTMQRVAQSVVASLNLGNSAFVSTLWQHVIGTPIDAVDLTGLTNDLTNGTFTQASLLSFAAANPINQNHVNLVGLAQHGLAYA